MKANQPELLVALAFAFNDEGISPRERKLAEAERQKATRWAKAHGRRERRTLVSTTALNDYVDWPGVRQCFKLVRERTLRGTTTSETIFGITSLPREEANAQRLLELTRQHWGIENKVFYVRDVSMGEDACRVRTSHSPLILATLRNAALNLLNWLRVSNKAAAFRRYAAHPQEALTLVKPSG